MRLILFFLTSVLFGSCGSYPLTILYKDHKMETYQVDYAVKKQVYSDTPQFKICLAENDSIIFLDLKSVLWYNEDNGWYRQYEDGGTIAVADSSENIQIYVRELIFYPVPFSFPKYYFSTTLDGDIHALNKKNLLTYYPNDTTLNQFLAHNRVRKWNKEKGEFILIEILNN